MLLEAARDVFARKESARANSLEEIVDSSAGGHARMPAARAPASQAHILSGKPSHDMRACAQPPRGWPAGGPFGGHISGVARLLAEPIFTGIPTRF